ncbi:SDR family NAD(P)-dependent oxidoreductase [Sedimentibacter sp. zth1]|uniref:SDR family NAD(P)-dependent oxidoreductase n=1 Tax=Sedimentibacter sp. zth1 TaxID=2816908 RepID=UPI001A91B98A|nr:SDR family NAD(P)-dependent oxidoreductase [Sedimentibacter sp. zth1]QSX05658.1 SDR family NAD(P)-dependent oxidoreductase [Sedimentibacter sp. zth1]
MEHLYEKSISLNDIKEDIVNEDSVSKDVAVIGISINTASGNYKEFWVDIVNGHSMVNRIDGQRKADLDYYNMCCGKKVSYYDGAFIKEIDKFDYKFFNLTPKEAQLMDPCQRLFLENTIKAIEDAGYGNERLSETNTRIYIGYAGNIKDSYLNMLWKAQPDAVNMAIVNNMNGMIGGRIAYMLNTHGIAEVIDTTCASSLVAVHEACESIINGNCSTAIVGSMRINMLPNDIEMSRIGVESKDYQTRTLDNDSDGFGEGDGVVTLVLKSLSAAKEDNDDIYAVLKGSAVSQGGKSMGVTVTNPQVLSNTIKKAVSCANIDGESIGMVEMHGTATKLGDPIEIQGLSDEFETLTDKKGICAIGSVKSNMGHLYEASGIMGLVKTILAVKNKIIPPTINLVTPNVEIDFVNSPFYINTKAKKWETNGDKRVALVDSLGLNGTNCNVIVEEYLDENKKSSEIGKKFLVISARIETSLKNLIEEYVLFLKSENINLNDLCYTACIGRWHYEKRLFIEFSTKNDLIKKLEQANKCQINDEGIFFSNNINTDEKNIDSYPQDEYEKTKLKYLNGDKINWEKYFYNIECNIIHIPVYCFDSIRCWAEFRPVVNESRQEEKSPYLFRTTWSEAQYSKPNPMNDVLVIGFSNNKVQKYYDKYLDIGIKAEYIILSDKINESISNNLINHSARQVVFVFEGEEYKDEIVCYEKIKNTLVIISKIFDLINPKYFALIIDTCTDILGNEIIYKDCAAIATALKAVEKENRELNVKIVEKDEETSLDRICCEVFNNENNYIVFRNDKKYLMKIVKESKCENTEECYSSGTYLVTSGTSIVTLAVCEAIAKKYNNSNFVLLTRRLDEYDSNSDDNSVLNNYDKDISEYILKITSLGNRVIVKKTEICNLSSVKNTIDWLAENEIEPEYVIHGAGNGASFSFENSNIENISQVIDPKVKALININSILGDNVKAYILFSSVATIFSAPYQSAYLAANAYLNSFCQEQVNKGKKVLSINWSTWKEIGMAIKNNVAYDLIFKAMPTKTAQEYIDTILEQNIIGNIIVGEFNTSKVGQNLIKSSKINIEDGIVEFSENTKNYKYKSDNGEVELTGKNDDNYSKTEKQVAQVCKEVLGYTSINVYDNFFEMGADSLQIMNMHKQLSKLYPNKLEVTDMFAYSSANKLANYLCDNIISNNESSYLNDDELNNDGTEINDNDIAIIGIASKIPYASSVDDFFETLLQGECMVNELPKWRKKYLLDFMRFSKQNTSDVKFLKSAYLEDVDKFDYEFFNISPREACLMDPHHRIYLELAVQVIEDAGYSIENISGTNTGVFLGFATNIKDMYLRMIADMNKEDIADAIVGNTQAVMSGRISHNLNLKGVSMVVDTACSSSLTALETAMQYITNNKIEAALVGGIKLILMPVEDNDLFRIGMESLDGYTRTFNQTATGTSFGESAQMIMIKSLKNAIRDRDNIYGVIKSAAINQDANSSGITAPNPVSQKEVILKAWQDANLNPEDLSYVEVHGTGTKLGDNIEYRSLNDAFRKYTNKKAFCAVNSVKPNYGHMSEGSGLFGIIKGLMALKHEKIPKNILFQYPNMSIDMADSAMYFNTKNIEWKAENNKRKFALSNFGMSGTNAHIVIEEHNRNVNDIQIDSKMRILTISNKKEDGFYDAINKLYCYVRDNEVDFANLSYTLNLGRGHYNYRMAIVCSNINEFKDALQSYISTKKCKSYAYVGHIKVIPDDREYIYDYEISNSKKLEFSKKALNENDYDELAKLYIKGADIDFSRFYSNDKPYRISAPTYSFEKKSCWIKVPELFDIDENLYYSIKWIKKSPQIVCNNLRNSYLIFANEENIKSMKIVKEIKLTENVILVNKNDIEEKLNSVELLADFLRGIIDSNIDGIINLLPLNSCADEQDAMKSTMLLFRLVKALLDINYYSNLKLITISTNTYKVTDKENKYNPYGAITHGINRVIGLELLKVSSYAIDIDEFTSISNIIKEIKLDKKEYCVSYRNNERYVEEFSVEDLEVTKGKLSINSKGAYVITGGAGGIGLFYAGCLAEINNNINIALIGRSNNYLCNAVKVEKISNIKKLGADIRFYQGDVSNKNQVNQIFEQIKTDFGHINGVIHAAGNASAEIIATRKESDFLDVINPKFSGTINVFNEIIRENVDFFVLCSSGCTLTGEASQADYVAANSFLDAFTYYTNQNNVKTHCINFSSWKSEGMSVRFGINNDLFFKALDNNDARSALIEVINSGIQRCFVGKLNVKYFVENDIDISSLPFEISKEIKGSIPIGVGKNKIEFVPQKTTSMKKSVNTVLEGKKKGKNTYTDTECEIARLFSEVLGFETVNIYDNFFEIGGDSILLSRLHGKIDEIYPGEIKLMDLFNYTSVNKIADFISNKENDNNDTQEVLPEVDDNMDSMINQFENDEISIDEMLNMLDN